MSNSVRIQQLLEYVKDDPNDPFNYYALALEFQYIDQKKAGFYYNKLLNEHKDYLPTYFHAAAFFIENGEKDKVIQIYETGLSLAEKLGDKNAYNELQNAYLNFQFEID